MGENRGISFLKEGSNGKHPIFPFRKGDKGGKADGIFVKSEWLAREAAAHATAETWPLRSIVAR